MTNDQPTYCCWVLFWQACTGTYNVYCLWLNGGWTLLKLQDVRPSEDTRETRADGWRTNCHTAGWQWHESKSSWENLRPASPWSFWALVSESTAIRRGAWSSSRTSTPAEGEWLSWTRWDGTENTHTRAIWTTCANKFHVKLRELFSATGKLKCTTYGSIQAWGRVCCPGGSICWSPPANTAASRWPARRQTVRPQVTYTDRRCADRCNPRVITRPTRHNNTFAQYVSANRG